MNVRYFMAPPRGSDHVTSEPGPDRHTRSVFWWVDPDRTLLSSPWTWHCPSSMAGVSLQDVSKVYGDNPPVISGVDLAIRDHEFMVLVGPSGCGKSTLLRMVAGLEEITSGTIRIGERVVNDVPPKDRDIAMVFQNYALYPHMTVYKNMAFGLKLRGMPKAQIQQRVAQAAKILDIEHL